MEKIEMKKFLTITLAFLMCLSSTAFAFASSDNGVSPCVDGHYTWKVTDKQVISYPYGSWRNGPSGKGAATLTFKYDKTSSYNIKVANTISGNYYSLAAIEKYLGVEIGQAESHSVSYSIKIPAGKTQQIIYRPQYRRYKVVETQFFVDHGISSSTGKTKISYVNVFNNWDFSKKDI